MSAVLAEQPKPVVMLSPGRHSLFQYKNNVHNVTVEAGTSLDTVCEPSFLAHVAGKFRLYDEIRVRVDDGAYWASLLVLAVGQTWVRTKVLQHVQIGESSVAVAADPMAPYFVKFRGPILKWSVIRRSDGAPLRERLDSKEEAERYMADHLRAASTAIA